MNVAALLNYFSKLTNPHQEDLIKTAGVIQCVEESHSRETVEFRIDLNWITGRPEWHYTVDYHERIVCVDTLDPTKITIWVQRSASDGPIPFSYENFLPFSYQLNYLDDPEVPSGVTPLPDFTIAGEIFSFYGDVPFDPNDKIDEWVAMTYVNDGYDPVMCGMCDYNLQYRW